MTIVVYHAEYFIVWREEIRPFCCEEHTWIMMTMDDARHVCPPPCAPVLPVFRLSVVLMASCITATIRWSMKWNMT